jgi:murein DD-endopeptidase MepM/ murein hydrolase activator NlpD
MPRKAMRSLSIFFFLLVAVGLEAGETSHTIREGETLFSVAKRAQIPVDVLSAYNGIDDAARVRVGCVIRFPSPYVVKKGDTLYGISHQFGVPLAKLLDLNGLTEHSVIKIGSRLYIPLDHAATASSRTGDSNSARTADTAARTTDTAVRPFRDSVSQTASPEEVVWPHDGRHEPLRGKISGLVFFGAEGDPVHSATSGEVKWVGPYWGWGKTVIIKSSDGDIILYAGNEQLLVNVGDRVSPGTEIARLGVSPQGGGAKLYFSIQGANGQFVDPEKFFSGKNHT